MAELKVNIDVREIERGAIEAFRESCFLLGIEFTKIISEPGVFKEFPDSDIVDTGQLRASQKVEFPKATEARFSWSQDYSLYVHEGYILRNGKKQPGRPWTQVGLDRFKFDDTYNKILKRKLK